jgi:hypothetical protein
LSPAKDVALVGLTCEHVKYVGQRYSRAIHVIAPADVVTSVGSYFPWTADQVIEVRPNSRYQSTTLRQQQDPGRPRDAQAQFLRKPPCRPIIDKDSFRLDLKRQRRAGRGLPKYDDVLTRQVLEHSVKREPFRLRLGAYIRHAHPVCVRYGDPRILFAIFHKHELAIGLQCSTEASKHLLWMRELVIHVDKERQIDGVVWKMRIRLRPLDKVDIQQMLPLAFLLNDA